jgi:3-oxoacyl-[acyl-carrier-protein] synthase-3
MIRTKILGLGSYVPDRVVTNEELPYLNDRHVRQETKQTETDDEWIQKRTGIKQRHYVPNDGSVATSDLALQAAKRALADANLEATDIDCIIFATLSPDFHFPGTAVVLQTKLGVAGKTDCACYDIRQQCSGFVYGLQMADAFIRTGMYKRVMLVGAELHSHSLDYTTRGRDVMVLFGDGAGVAILGPMESDDPRAGVMYTSAHADGNGAKDLNLKIFEINRLPYLDYSPMDRENNQLMYPHMDGKRVFLNAVRGMVMSTNTALAKTGLTWDDIQWFVPHQANLRIIDSAADKLGLDREHSVNVLTHTGNTSAASIPLALTAAADDGRFQPGDLLLMSGFGAGMTWASAVVRWQP